MKKIIGIIIVLIIIVIAIALIVNLGGKPSSENEIINESNTESKEIEEGYEIIVSKENITIEKGSEASFDIIFTNPVESSIREYIKCEDQNDIILVKYSDLKDKKITVDVEALKTGPTEIMICDYNYPNKKAIVKVTVVETN